MDNVQARTVIMLCLGGADGFLWLLLTWQGTKRWTMLFTGCRAASDTALSRQQDGS